ncbi:hypothetical protein SALBM311S_03082 [Streptomyces alboniger]
MGAGAFVASPGCTWRTIAFSVRADLADRIPALRPGAVGRGVHPAEMKLPSPHGRRRSGGRAGGRLNRRRGPCATRSPASAARSGSSLVRPARMEPEIHACRRHSAAEGFRGKATAEHDLEPRRALACSRARGRTPRSSSAPGVDADCAAGEAARMTQGPRDPLSPGRTDPPVQLPQPWTPRYALSVPPCRRPAPLTQDPLQEYADTAGLILDFSASVYNVTVTSGLGHFTQAEWPHTCRGLPSPGSPVWARSPMGKWAASSWRNASVSPSRATAANLSCSTTN